MSVVHVLYHNTRDGIVPQWNFIPTAEQVPHWHAYPDDIFDMDLVDELPNSGLRYSRLDDVPPGDPWIYELRNYYDLGMYPNHSDSILGHFVSEPRLMSDLRSGHGYLLFNDRREGFLDPWFIGVLLEAWDRHGIPRDRVIYATGAFNAADVLAKRGGGMRPLVVRQCELVSNRHLNATSHPTPDPDAIDRRFLCFNRKIEDREYRMQLLSLVEQRGLLPHFYYSFGAESTRHDLLERARLLDEPPHWRTHSTMLRLGPRLPMTLDTDQWQVNLAFEHRPTQVGAFYGRSGISLVPETLFYGDEVFFSEKVLHAIRYLHPFIIAGTPGTLAQMRSLGYETWSDWWDEGYDGITDHHARMEAVVELVAGIAAWPSGRWDDFIRGTRAACLRNRDRLSRFDYEVSYVDQLRDLWPDR